jgi:hypothetical protein
MKKKSEREDEDCEEMADPVSSVGRQGRPDSLKVTDGLTDFEFGCKKHYRF